MSKPAVCLDLEPDLVAAATGEAGAAAAERVASHVERCGSCRDDFVRYRAIDGEVAAVRSHLLAEPHVRLARAELEARLADLRSRLVAYQVFPSPFGNLLIARSEQGCLMVEFLERSQRPDAYAARRLAGFELVESSGEIERFGRELGEYLEGRRRRLDWPLDLRLARSDFHREVLKRTAAIPYGAVASYSGIAHDVGRPRGGPGGGPGAPLESHSARDPLPPRDRKLGPAHRLRRGDHREEAAAPRGGRGAHVPGARRFPGSARPHVRARAGRPGVLPAVVRVVGPVPSGWAPVRVSGSLRGGRPRALHVLPARPPPAGRRRLASLPRPPGARVAPVPFLRALAPPLPPFTPPPARGLTRRERGDRPC